MVKALDFLKLAKFTPKQLKAWRKIDPGKGEGKRFLLRDLLRQILAERLESRQDN